MMFRSHNSQQRSITGRVYLSTTGNLVPAQIHWDHHGRIEQIQRLDTRTKDLPIILPGFIDEHVHGANGHDVMEASWESWQAISEALARHGVTSFLATTITAPWDDLERVMACANEFPQYPYHNLIGLHFEGPYIDPAYKGAQPQEAIRPIAIQEVQSIVGRFQSATVPLRLMTIAPNVPLSGEVISWLRHQGIHVNLGHSGANREQTLQAIAHGADGITHLFNAMKGLHHRDPGMVGVGLITDELWIELITDGIHIHPDIVRLVFHVASSRIILVTDGMSAIDCPPGKYHLGQWIVNVDEEAVRLDDGTLAGSILTPDQSIRNLLQWGCSLREIVHGWCEAPAIRLGLRGHGRIEKGYYADLVQLNQDYQVMGTLKHGQWISPPHG